MDYASLIQNIQDFGIGIVALIIFGYILYVVIKSNKSVLDMTLENSQKNQEWFLGFVNENNHQKTDMIKEHTEAMIEVKNAIETNTKSTEMYNRTLEILATKLTK